MALYFSKRILLLTNRRTSLHTGLIYKTMSSPNAVLNGRLRIISKSLITGIKVITRHLVNPSKIYKILAMSYQ